TSTIGAVAAAAAVGHMLELDESRIRSALALAVAQAGGLQRNFGTMTKPLQAGFASAAGVRAALMARAGITGDSDIFARGGFLDMYAGVNVSNVEPRIDLTSDCIKLYPCCYGAHRMIAAALQLHATDLANKRFEVIAPAGQLQPLRVVDPASGLEAKFCARYIVATALLRGAVTFADFTDEAIQQRDRRALMERVVVTGSPDTSAHDTLEAGEVVLNEFIGDTLQRSIRIEAYPGSARAPATDAQRDAKLIDCLDVYSRAAGKNLSLAEFRTMTAQLCGVSN
ncbi:MAG TPA: MmgE/PrpD family protein, partial [Steroidobacter sp.]|nr:MmgE/PrpD family protein [Steroidobacter sp.]